MRQPTSAMTRPAGAAASGRYIGILLLLSASMCFVSLTTANMIAIDLGSEYLKVAAIKPGKVPIQIVVNEMSRRKSPALVGLVPAGDAAQAAGGGSMERVLGEEAFSLSVRFPETSFSRTRDLLTRPPGHPMVTKMIKEHLLPFEVVAHPNRTACASVRGGLPSSGGDAVPIHSAEELVVSSTAAMTTWEEMSGSRAERCLGMAA